MRTTCWDIVTCIFPTTKEVNDEAKHPRQARPDADCNRSARGSGRTGAGDARSLSEGERGGKDVAPSPLDILWRAKADVRKDLGL